MQVVTRRNLRDQKDTLDINIINLLTKKVNYSIFLFAVA